MYFDKFDIVEAHYLFCADYHSGQNSPLYKRLCRIMTRFQPRPNMRNSTLSENGREIYNNLVKKHKEQPNG